MVGVNFADMQKVATTRPLVAEIFSECGRIKAGILLSLSKILVGILQITILLQHYCGNTSIGNSVKGDSARYIVISSIM